MMRTIEVEKIKNGFIIEHKSYVYETRERISIKEYADNITPVLDRVKDLLEKDDNWIAFKLSTSPVEGDYLE